MPVIAQTMLMQTPLPPNHPKVMWFTTKAGELCHFYYREGFLTDSKGTFILDGDGKTVPIKNFLPADKEIIKKHIVRQPASKPLENIVSAISHETVDYGI